MRMWYRVLVAAMVAAATFCTTALICLGFDLWQAGEDQWLLPEGESFSWSNGFFEARGELANGRLERMVVERVLPQPTDER